VTRFVKRGPAREPPGVFYSKAQRISPIRFEISFLPLGKQTYGQRFAFKSHSTLEVVRLIMKGSRLINQTAVSDFDFSGICKSFAKEDYEEAGNSPRAVGPLREGDKCHCARDRG